MRRRQRRRRRRLWRKGCGMCKGKVILIGAGPGDPGLITVKGKRLIEQAEVIVFDRLTSPELLDLAPSAEKIDVGKRQGNHPVPQDEINRILIEQASLGKRVVRLKGGDPYIFGRGGEEAEALRDKGIAFEVVPGIPSAVAGLNYAGIPATHRDAASSLHIITGHARAGQEIQMDFDALCRVGGTLVFLMSVSSMDVICRGLIDAGMDPETPAAVVENGTTAGQRKKAATLGTIVDSARAMALKSPALLAVGDVCALNEKLDWFGSLPLAQTTVVVTRPKARAGTLTERLQTLGAQVVSMPCIETQGCTDGAAERALSEIDRYNWLVITSPLGVSYLFTCLTKLGLDARALAPVKIAAIGAATAQELACRGISVEYVPERYDAVHLAEGLASQMGTGDRALLLRAGEGTPELTEILDRRGAAYDDVPLYETVYTPEKWEEVRDLLTAEGVQYVTFTSASTVEAFAACISDSGRYDFTAVCIGSATEATAKAKGYRTITASNATMDNLIQRIIEEENR